MSFLTKEITLPRRQAKRPSQPVDEPALPAPSRRTPRRPSLDLGFARRSGAAVTGLDISATQLIAADAHLEGGRIVADRLVARPLAPGLVRDGLVLDVPGLAAELREFFSEQKLNKRVRVGLATPRTVLRVIDVPPIDEADVAAVLPMLAQETMPMPLEGAVLDHQVVGLVDTPEGRRLRLTVVAAEREGVETLVETLELAGLRPAGIDLSVFAAMRAVAGAEASAQPVLYAQLGDLVNLAVAENGVCRFTRQAPQGLAFILARLADARDLTFEAALDMLVACASETPGDPNPGDVRDVGALLSRVSSELGSELRATAEFYGTQYGTPVREGVLTGPLVTLRGFADALADASGLSLRCGAVAVSGSSASADVDPRIAAVAAGLAIEKVVA